MRRCVVVLIGICTISLSISGLGTSDVSKQRQPTRDFSFVSVWPETEAASYLIAELSERYRAEVNPAFNLEFDYVPRQSIRQRIGVMMASNDVPDLFAYEAGEPLSEAGRAGIVPDFRPIFEGLGLASQLRPQAVAAILAGSASDVLYAIPQHVTIEGFWINPDLIAKSGVPRPSTWRQFVSASEMLYRAGVQPLALASEGDGDSPIARFLNAVVISQQQSETAAEIVLDEMRQMNREGYFSTYRGATGPVDATMAFLEGNVAMLYVGGRGPELLARVRQGHGVVATAEFVPLSFEAGDFISVGPVLTMSKARLDHTSRQWMQFVFSRYADLAFSDLTMITGFTLDTSVRVENGYALSFLEAVENAEVSGRWAKLSGTLGQESELNRLALLYLNGRIGSTAYLDRLAARGP